MAIYLSDTDVRSVIQMPDIFGVVEQAFKDHGLGLASNLHRQRARVPKGVYRVMSGAMPGIGAMGSKVGLHGFEVPAGIEKAQDMTVLYSTDTGEVLAVIWSSAITDYRTGAMSGVAAKYLACSGSKILGILGSGKQARTQLMALVLARPIRKVLVYSPNPQHRKAYAEEMSQKLGMEVVPVENAKRVVEAAEILVTATDSEEPVFDGDWLQEGTHVISIRSAHKVDISLGRMRRGEIDERTVERSNLIAMTALEQAEVQESPDLIDAIRQNRVVELGAIIAGRAEGRTSERQITLCRCFGMGLLDVAAAGRVYQLAVGKGLGLKLPWP